jgi:hypothetical protein
MIKTKLYLTLILLSSMIESCSSQNKMDLEKVSFNENIKTVLKGLKKSAELRDLQTTLPAYTIKEVALFKFGNISFAKDDKSKSISFYLKDTSSKKIAGLSFQTENASEGSSIKSYIDKKYGQSQILHSLSKSQNSKILLGYSSFIWKKMEDSKSMFLTVSYSEENKKQLVKTEVIIIDNTIKDTDPNTDRTVVDRIILSLKE